MLRVSMDKVVSVYNNVNGGHWFSKGTMRFFNSRLSKYGYLKGDNYYFISSESNFGGRMYTVRCMTSDGDINNVSEFNTLTRTEARKMLSEVLGCKVKDL